MQNIHHISDSSLTVDNARSPRDSEPGPTSQDFQPDRSLWDFQPNQCFGGLNRHGSNVLGPQGYGSPWWFVHTIEVDTSRHNRFRTKSAERCDLLHQDTPLLLAHPILTVLHHFRYIHRFTCFSRTVPDRILVRQSAMFHSPLIKPTSQTPAAEASRTA